VVRTNTRVPVPHTNPELCVEPHGPSFAVGFTGPSAWPMTLLALARCLVIPRRRILDPLRFPPFIFVLVRLVVGDLGEVLPPAHDVVFLDAGDDTTAFVDCLLP